MPERHTKATPGITKFVINVPNALRCVPFSKLGHRNTSKLLVPNMCRGSTAPVEGFRKSLLTNISFHDVMKFVSTSKATCRLPSMPRKRDSARYVE